MGEEHSTHRRRSSSTPEHEAKSRAAAATAGASRHDDILDGESDVETLLEHDAFDDEEEVGLNHEERKKRRQWKWQSMRLDGRIGGGPGQDIMSTEMLRSYFFNAVLIGLWYSFSIGISVYNKWMFSGKDIQFPFPLFTTCAHMLVQFSLAGAVLYFVPQFRPKTTSHDYHRLGGEDADPPAEDEPKKPIMTRWFYLTRIGPCGCATALDIGLGNFSLRFITLTFYTMCKSSVLAFVLLFAFLFRLEKPSWSLFSIIAIMTVGVVLMVTGEVTFHVLGFILIMSAAFCSGLRWSLTQILLLRNSATSNPFSSIFFLTPVMFVCLLVLAVPIEGPINVINGFRDLAETKGTFMSILIMLCPGILAFMMVASEFALLKRTSVVTLSVCGIFKEVLTISTAARTFGDELSPVNISGLFITILAIAAYNWLKYQKMRRELSEKSDDMKLSNMTHDRSSDADRVPNGTLDHART